jgi:nucleoid-associated protein YgaU
MSRRLAALAFSVLCAGCVAASETPEAARPQTWAVAALVQPPAPATPSPPNTAPIVPIGPEEFVCLNGARIEVNYSEARDSMTVRLNGAAPVALQRADESGLTAFRSERLVLRRSGPRIALSSETAQVTVQEGDSLSRIALRTYGDYAAAAEIARANGIANPDLIFPGQVLRLPAQEHRCRRTERQLSALVEPGAEPRALRRQAFSPPSSRQPELRRIQATSVDPAPH